MPITPWTALPLFLATTLLAATPEECTDILRKALEDKNPETRVQAVAALSLTSDTGPLFNLLRDMLDDKDVGVRQAAVNSLAEIKTPAALDALRSALEDEVPEVSFAAAKALWLRHDPAGKKALLAVLEGETKTSSGFLTKQKRDALRMMHTPRTTFLFALRQGVGFAPIPGLGEGIASMQGILTDSGTSGRATTALMLGNDRDPAILAALRDALSDNDASVRAAAVHSLALRNDPSLQREIEPLLTDPKTPVRLRAAAAYLRLAEIRHRRAKPAAAAKK